MIELTEGGSQRLIFLIYHCRIYFISCTCVAACMLRYSGNAVLLILPIYTCRRPYIVYGHRVRTCNDVHVLSTGCIPIVYLCIPMVSPPIFMTTFQSKCLVRFLARSEIISCIITCINCVAILPLSTREGSPHSTLHSD